MRCMHHLRAARESGLLSTVQVQGGKNGVFDVGILLDYIYLYILLLCYIAIYLYIYILFLFLTSTSIFYDSGCRLSINWLFTVQRYGGSVRYQTPGDALFG